MSDTGRFWLYHLIWPLVVFTVFVLVIEWSHFDLQLADWLFELQGGRWVLKDHFITSALLHDVAQNISRLIGLGLLLLAVISHVNQRLAPYKKGFWLLFASSAMSVSIVLIIKAMLHVDCPWDLQRYGGDYPYLSLYISHPDTVNHGACFPAGHASGGYGLITLYFFFLRYKPLWKWVGLSVGLTMGIVYGFNQQLRGAHFISHDLWTLLICWTVSVLWYWLLFRRNSLTGAHPGNH